MVEIYADIPFPNNRDVSLLDLLDKVLDKGIVIAGDLTIAVADVDLIYLGLRLVLTSVENLESCQIRMVK